MMDDIMILALSCLSRLKPANLKAREAGKNFRGKRI